MTKQAVRVLLGIGFSLFILQPAQARTPAASCQRLGWFPTSFGLKDHSVFWYDGYYYLVSIYLRPENQFAYARSTDLCTWENLSPILSNRTPGTPDESAIWAPFVYFESGIYYMYYTGVTNSFVQTIMLATSTNPADPNSWKPEGKIFQPSHPDRIWDGVTWSDCRDPTVVKMNNLYYLYYTGLDNAGGIVGLATSTTPRGPWIDWGPVVISSNNAMLESSTLASHGGLYYLFYNEVSQGERFRIGPTPAGPWSKAEAFAPGWAHEIWQGQDGYTYTSFLTDYTVTISRLTWDIVGNPPHPFIGDNVYHVMMPLAVR